MKQIITIIMFTLPLCLSAQEQSDSVLSPLTADTVSYQPQFGVLDYQAVLEQMPEYKQAIAQVDSLRQKYDAESLRAESEFQRKFAEFLEGQKDFPKNIMEKRQKELQTLLEESINFRQSCQKLLRQAESDLTANARRRLDAAMRAVAVEHNLLFIFNNPLDKNEVPQLLFIDENRIIDVEPLIMNLIEL